MLGAADRLKPTARRRGCPGQELGRGGPPAHPCRTLTWGLLTLLLGGGYATVVLGLGRLLPEGSSLVVAAATLVAAAVFQPLRRRVQAAVDRRFNRRRHAAGRIIEAFGARLRDQVDLDTLTGEVLAVVEETMQPTRASLWLRAQPPAGTVGAAAAP